MKKEFHSPKSWNQLLHWGMSRQHKAPSKALLTVYAILMTDTTHLLTPDEDLPNKRLAITKELLGLSDDFLLKWQQDCIDSVEDDRDTGELVFLDELNQMADQVTGFLLERIEEENENIESIQYQVALGLTDCPYPILPGKRKNLLHAPGNGLENINLYEMATTFSIFENFMETGDENYAIELIATLYRSAKPKTKQNLANDYEGDIRMPYLKAEHTTQLRKPAIRKLPKLMRQLIVFWFACCRHKIIEDHPTIFTRGGESDNNSNDFGWAGVLFSLGGLQDLDTVGQQSAHTALLYLSFLEAQRKKAEFEASMQVH